VSRELKRVRVLLAEMPPMLQDIVADAVTGEPRVQVIGRLRPRESLSAALDRVHADVVIAAARHPDLAVAETVWSRWPRVKVLLIADRGRKAVLYVLRPDEVVLTDVSPKALAAAIRGDREHITRRLTRPRI
jgi:DNA-binding NarL/FixJ family response regulator